MKERFRTTRSEQAEVSTAIVTAINTAPLDTRIRKPAVERRREP
jgi:hypothetical protein